jgi:hypothetical protein
MKVRFTAFAVLIALLSAFTLAPSAASAARPRDFLRNIPVSGALEDGGTFTGVLTITKFGYNRTRGLTVDGVLLGKATLANGRVVDSIVQRFRASPTTLNETAAASSSATYGTAQASCDILFLNLGPLSLNLLGLTVDLSEITLDINAIPGPGNLLGNLLCAIAGLLDPGGLLEDLLGDLGTLIELLTLLNRLLG